jgi:hypothetical protein
VLFWALASRELDEVIEFFGSPEQAQEALAGVLLDEPEWADLLFVTPVELAGPELAPSLN